MKQAKEKVNKNKQIHQANMQTNKQTKNPLPTNPVNLSQCIIKLLVAKMLSVTHYFLNMLFIYLFI